MSGPVSFDGRRSAAVRLTPGILVATVVFAMVVVVPMATAVVMMVTVLS
jgi:hypothetical protein